MKQNPSMTDAFMLIALAATGLVVISRGREICQMVPFLCGANGGPPSPPPPPSRLELIGASIFRPTNFGPGEWRVHWDVVVQSGGAGSYFVRADLVPSHSLCQAGLHNTNVIASTQAPMPVEGVGIYGQDALLYYGTDYHFVDMHAYILDTNNRIVEGTEKWTCYLPII